MGCANGTTLAQHRRQFYYEKSYKITVALGTPLKWRKQFSKHRMKFSVVCRHTTPLSLLINALGTQPHFNRRFNLVECGWQRL